MGMIDAAVRYARRGLPVFPCIPGAKIPLTEHGCNDASSSLDQVREWWAEYPDANIGMACGEKSFVVLDYDVKNGKRGRETRDNLHRRFIIDTLTATTPS